MLLLRIKLPDIPGSLGAVATAMGGAGADISAIEIVEKGPDYAIDHFIASLPPGALPDNLVSAINRVPGVKVLWLSRYPENWGIESDIETLNRMSDDPAHAAQTLTSSAPTVFHSQWAVLIDTTKLKVIGASELAPLLDAKALARLAPFDAVRRFDLLEGWLPNWGETTIAMAPLKGERAIMIGRLGGPVFLDSELNRLQHLATLAN